MQTESTASPHIVHLSIYPLGDIRLFQKACRAERDGGFRVSLVLPHGQDEVREGIVAHAIAPPRGRLDRMTRLPLAMYRKAITLDGDLYQIHHPDLIPAGVLLKMAGKRVIYESRESFADKIRSMHWIPPQMRAAAAAAFSQYERWVSLLWDYTIVADRHSARSYLGRPVTVVPNYPMLIPVQRRPRISPRRTLIYVGGIIEDRGLSVMLRIAELLEDKNIHLELMGPCRIAGDEEKVRQARNVTYYGNCSLEAVYQHLAQADLGLLLLQPVAAYAYAGENTQKMFEYMWCELPFIASDFPNLKEIVEGADAGVCVNPNDADAAVQTILALLGDEERMREMGRNGKRAVEGMYNWPALSDVMLQTYRAVLEGRQMRSQPLQLWNRPPEVKSPSL